MIAHKHQRDHDLGMLILAAQAHSSEARWWMLAAAWAFGKHRIVRHLGRGGRSINLGGITINAAQGQSPTDIARAVRREIERVTHEGGALHEGGLIPPRPPTHKRATRCELRRV